MTLRVRRLSQGRPSLPLSLCPLCVHFITEAREQTSGDQWARGGGEGEDGEGEKETQTPTNRTDTLQVCAVPRRG